MRNLETSSSSESQASPEVVRAAQEEVKVLQKESGQDASSWRKKLARMFVLMSVLAVGGKELIPQAAAAEKEGSAEQAPENDQQFKAAEGKIFTSLLQNGFEVKQFESYRTPDGEFRISIHAKRPDSPLTTSLLATLEYEADGTTLWLHHTEGTALNDAAKEVLSIAKRSLVELGK